MVAHGVVVHSSPGRLRLRVASQKGDAAALDTLAGKLKNCPGVAAVETNPLLGSILLLHETTRAAIEDYAREGGLLQLVSPQQVKPAGPLQFRTDIRKTFREADEKVRTLSSGEMDMSGLVVTVLVGAGAIQILSGNAGALPWYGAFWYAFNIFLKTKETEG